MKSSLYSFLLLLVASLQAVAAESAIPQTPGRLWGICRPSGANRLSAKLKDNPHHKLLDRQIKETKRLNATKTTIATASKRVTDTLTPAEQQNLFVFGSLPDLRRDRPAWTVNHPGDFGSGFEACIAADSGELLFMDHTRGLTPATPNHALQRTGSAVTAPAADHHHLSTHRQVPRPLRLSLSLGR
ncbi:MAG: hypothetical protein R3F31_19615 [Verrucomicrobiales bacterium]